MPKIICINCFAKVYVKGDSLICWKCEDLESNSTDSVPAKQTSRTRASSKAGSILTVANPEQPTYLQVQTLIDEIREVKKLVSVLRWLVPIGFLIIIANIVVVGVKVNLSPTLYTPFNG